MLIDYCKYLTCLTIFQLTFGCTSQQKVILGNDGAVSVLASDDEPDQYTSFYSTELVQKLAKNSDGNIVFNIKTIDSLGNYLSPIYNKNFFFFRSTGDTLILTTGGGRAFRRIGCNAILEVSSEAEIKNIITANSGVKLKNNKVIIKRSKYLLANRRKKLQVKIILK